MAYGIEVSNSDGRTVFSTEENYAGFVASTATSLSGFGNNAPSLSTGEALIARPQDNESGVIGYGLNQGLSKFYGVDVYEQNFGAADGVKYRILTRSTLQTPNTSGYGLEVYNSSSEVLFSSETQRRPELLAAGILQKDSTADTFVYTCPTGVPFNEVYIDMRGLTGSASYVFSQMAAAYAYFNNTAKTVTVRQVEWNVPSSFSAFTEQIYWDQQTDDSINVFPQFGLFASTISFFIYRVRE